MKEETKQMKSVRVILFDLDGTLVDTTDLIVNTFLSVLSEYEINMFNSDDVKMMIGRPLREQMTDIYSGDIDSIMNRYQELYFELHDNYAREVPGIRQLLTELKRTGFRLGVVTSKRKISAYPELESFGLVHLFEHIICADDTVLHKPFPDPLHEAIGRFGGAIEDFVYVGDTIFDIQAANSAGMKSLAVTWGPVSENKLHSENPTLLVHSIEELMSAFV